MMEEPKKILEEVKEKVDEASKKTGDMLDITRGKAVFKAKIRDQYRITVPEAERESLDLEVGDLVQVSLEKLEE